jgi:hypothetical protein
MVQPLGFGQAIVEHKDYWLLKSLIIWAFSSIMIMKHEV